MRKHQRVKENGSADVSAVQNVMFCNEVWNMVALIPAVVCGKNGIGMLYQQIYPARYLVSWLFYIYRNISAKMAAFGGAVSVPVANSMIALPPYWWLEKGHIAVVKQAVVVQTIYPGSVSIVLQRNIRSRTEVLMEVWSGTVAVIAATKLM